MELIHYKKINKDELQYNGPFVSDKTRINHVYEGNLTCVDKILTGAEMLFVKKNDVERFKNGCNTISLFPVRLIENYHKDYSLAHSIQSHVNGLVVDEIKQIAQKYQSGEYMVMPMVDLGQFLERDSFEENEHVSHNRKNECGTESIEVMIKEPSWKKTFTYMLSKMIGIGELLEEIKMLKKSEDVYYVHHPEGVGYATNDKERLQEISGYTYENFLIEKE